MSRTDKYGVAVFVALVLLAAAMFGSELGKSIKEKKSMDALEAEALRAVISALEDGCCCE